MVELDRDTRDKIIETHTEIKHIRNELAIGRKRFDKHEMRIRRIENLFLPILLIMSVFAHKIMKWAGL